MQKYGVSISYHPLGNEMLEELMSLEREVYFLSFIKNGGKIEDIWYWLEVRRHLYYFGYIITKNERVSEKELDLSFEYISKVIIRGGDIIDREVIDNLKSKLPNRKFDNEIIEEMYKVGAIYD